MEIIETVVVVLSIFLVGYLFVAQPHQVNGLSMFPTFDNADYVLTDKVSYKFKQPERGDVVVFKAPPEANCPKGAGCDFIKRVLALPGEKIEVKNNTIQVNGKAISEPYIPKENLTQSGAFLNNRSITLGPGEYFVVGDNRLHSSDSRAWGPITSKEIVGRVFFRYWPVKSIEIIKDPTY